MTNPAKSREVLPDTVYNAGRLSSYTMNLNNLLTKRDLPLSGYPAGEELKWLCGDNLENYRQHNGHPLYGENDISYKLNSLGYRCPEFDVSADIRVVAVGCSYVFGLALPKHAIFHELFAERLRTRLQKSVVVWNLGVAGSSNDYISRLLYFALPRLNPDIVLINFTQQGRREYVSAQDQYIRYCPNSNPSNQILKDIYGHLDALSSPFNDALNFFKNYKAVEHLLADRQWLYSHISPQQFEAVAAHMDLRRYVGPLTRVDKARDGGHPGPECHRRLAELYWTRFVELGGLAYASNDGIGPDDDRQTETRPTGQAFWALGDK